MADNIPDNDQELLLRIAAGDEAAFRQLILSYSSLLHTYLLRHTESQEIAEEIVQDVFVQIWLTRESLRNVRNMSSFLFVISRNRAYNEMKRLGREKMKQKDWQEQALAAVPDDDAYEAKIEAGLNMLSVAIEQLSPQQQRAWILCRQEGLTYQQAADTMQISKETVKSYLQVANTSISKYLTGRIDLWILLLLVK